VTDSIASYDLRASPFFRLGTTPRDDRSAVVRASEEAEVPAALRTALRNELLNPRRRVSCEVGWNPGGDSALLMELLRERSGDRLDDRLEALRLSPLGRANLRAHCAADTLFPGSEDVVIGWIVALAEDAAAINGAEVMTAINADREVSDFVPLTSGEWLAEALAERERAYAAAVRDVLERLRPEVLVAALTAASERLTAHGTRMGPSLLTVIIERYAVETEHYRSTELARIKELAAHLAGASMPPDAYAVLESRLGRMVRRWDAVSQPIQLARQASGRDEPLSLEVATCLRDLAIRLHNESARLPEARFVMALISDVFREIPVVANRALEEVRQIEINYYTGVERTPPATSSADPTA